MSSHLLPDGRIPVLLSSDTAELLRREAAAILAYVEQRPTVTPRRVADMIFRTRSARKQRSLAMVTGRDELLVALRAIAAGEPHPAVVTSATSAIARKVGFVFPGQGSQRPGMGALFYERSPDFRAAVDECDVIFQDLFQISPLSYLLGNDHLDDDVRIVQPALFMQMIGLAAIWRAAGVEPAATIGHSQGEIAAACVSGIISLADGVRVVALRARMVATVCHEHGLEGQYSMAVVGVDRAECEALLARKSGWAELSVINSAHVIAISGELSMVTDVIATLNAEGKFAKEIRVAYPAHTSIVSKFRRELCDSLADQLDNQGFAETEIPCFGATLGTAVTADLPTEYWFWNLRNRVRFDLAIDAAATYGVDTFIEIADHPALMLAIMENLSSVERQRDFQMIGTSRRTAQDLGEFTKNLGAVAVNDLGYEWSALRTESAAPPELPLLHFPNTHMAPKHLWAAYDYPAQTVSSDDRAGVDGVENITLATESAGQLAAPAPAHRVVERWERLTARALVPPRTLAIVDPTGRGAELAAAIAAAAAPQGVSLVDLANTANSAGTVYNTLVVLVPEPNADDTDTAVTELAEFLGNREWLPDLTGVRDVWLVTVGGEQVLDTDLPALFPAAAQAGFRCLAIEYAGVRLRHLDLAAGRPLTASARTLIGAVHTAGEPELAVRDDGVYAKRLIAADTPEATPLGADELREVVIVGGTGKLGLDFCEQFVRAGARRITLLSRSGGSAAAKERIERIKRIGATDVLVRTCDVTDPEAVRALGQDYVTTPADLIVHAAVDYHAAVDINPATVLAAAAPKIIALEHLVEHFPRTSSGRIVLCSSLSATIGGRGHMTYAAVNRMLDAGAARLRGRGVDCTSVQWGLWREIGADQQDAEARISGTGLLAMDPANAVTAGFTTESGNVIVATADWGRIEDIFTALGFGPLFSGLDIEAPPEPVAVPAPAPDAVEPVATAPAAAVPDAADTVRLALRSVMGMDSSESIDGATPLVALGLDSIQALDLRKRIEVELKRDLPVTAILGGASLDEVLTLLG